MLRLVFKGYVLAKTFVYTSWNENTMVWAAVERVYSSATTTTRLNSGKWAFREVVSLNSSNVRLSGSSMNTTKTIAVTHLCHFHFLLYAGVYRGQVATWPHFTWVLGSIEVWQWVLSWQGLKSPQESMADLSPVENLRIPSKVNFMKLFI